MGFACSVSIAPTAPISQEEMKLALILNVIDPKIGGVMIMGDRGTGKSTTIRALADLLPEMKVNSKHTHMMHKNIWVHDCTHTCAGSAGVYVLHVVMHVSYARWRTRVCWGGWGSV